MELPREIQMYIYGFLYDEWREKWSSVMREVLRIEIKSKRFPISGLLLKRWNKKEIKICMDCGNYYRIPMYSCERISCSCL